MKFARAFRVVAGLLTATLVISCADKSPTTAPQADLIGALTGTVAGTLNAVVGKVLQCSPLPYASATKNIGPAGGFMVIGHHLFVVPPGALDHQVTITGVAPSDRTRSVQFSPAGLHFQHSAYLTLDYEGCGLLVNLLPKVAYTTDLLAILNFVPSLADTHDHLVTGQIDHFSRYATAY
ncbi:MAG TPA: hypothetical protein VGI92_06355 [Gemmatimonadales bacterium]|jgi:hypothetical protein